MDCLTFIAKLTEHLAWPAATIVIIMMLRAPIANIIGKLKKANIKGSEFEFSSQPEQKTDKLKTTPVNIPIPTDTVGMQQEYETLIRRDIEAANIQTPADVENILVSHLAASQLNATYDRINSSIFGSQIDLLRSLNSITEPAQESSLQIFYDDAATKYPDYYKQYSFEKYLDYLIQMSLIERQENTYRITQLAIGFLVYIAEKGLTGYRHY